MSQQPPDHSAKDPATAASTPQSRGAGDAVGSTHSRFLQVPGSRRLEAVQSLLRSDKGGAERFIRFAGEHRIHLDAMWARLDDAGRVAMAALASPGAGRTATLFATTARGPGDIAPLSELIRHALVSLGRRRAMEGTTAQAAGQSGDRVPGDDSAVPAIAPADPAPLHLLPAVDLVQALVDPSEFRQAEALARGGMERLAELSYLERSTPRGPAEPVSWPDDLRAETWDARRRDELIAALERSYVGTLDCPALAGLRRGEDVLEGHLHSGTYEPALWTVVRFADGERRGSIAGVCLFNSSPPNGAAAPTGSLELVYFGLVPEARGRGLGRLLLRHGLDGLRGRREGTVLLAVDDRNGPAHRIYREAGFRVRFRRIAYIHALRRQAAPGADDAPRRPA